MITEAQKKLQQHWEDYLFLTEEMKKFLLQRELDMFFALLEQRGFLLQSIQTVSKEETAYYELSANRELIREVKAENKDLLQVFHITLNSIKRRENVANAYEGGGDLAGQYLNRHT